MPTSKIQMAIIAQKVQAVGRRAAGSTALVSTTAEESR